MIVQHFVDSAGRLTTLDSLGVVRRRLPAEPIVGPEGPRPAFQWHHVATDRLPCPVAGVAADMNARLVVRCADGSFHREIVRQLGRYDHGQQWEPIEAAE